MIIEGKTTKYPPKVKWIVLHRKKMFYFISSPECVKIKIIHWVNCHVEKSYGTRWWDIFSTVQTLIISHSLMGTLLLLKKALFLFIWRCLINFLRPFSSHDFFCLNNGHKISKRLSHFSKAVNELKLLLKRSLMLAKDF